jgi:hypothetical protein
LRLPKIDSGRIPIPSLHDGVLALQLLRGVLVAPELEQQYVRRRPQKLADVDSGDMEGIDVAVDKDGVEVDIGHTVYPLEDQLVARQGIHRRVKSRLVLPAGVRDPLHVLLVQSSEGIRYLARVLQLEVDLGGGSLRITARLELGIGGPSPLPARQLLGLQGHPSSEEGVTKDPKLDEEASSSWRAEEIIKLWVASQLAET